MTKKLKRQISTIVFPFIMISLTAGVYAEEGSYDSSVPIFNEFVFENSEDMNMDTSYYEELEKAYIEKNQRYEAFKRGRASYPVEVSLNVSWQQQKTAITAVLQQQL